MATPECSEFEATCATKLRELQNRAALPALPASAKEVHERVRTTLQKAVRAELLKTGAYEVSRLLRPISESTWLGGGTAYEFSCGPTSDNLKDCCSHDCLVRDDAAVLSFSVTMGVRRGNSTLELIAYRFDLTFPVGDGPRFVRFDLDQRHDKDGLRAHVHPGLADGRLPSPILDPVEALHFLIVHLRTR